MREGYVRSRGLVTRLMGEPSRVTALIVLTLVLTRGAQVAALSAQTYLTEHISSEDARAVGRWLAVHARPGAVVAPTRWDLFPWLFFYDYDSRFLSGLDPIYSVAADPALFWRWHHLVYDGTWCADADCTPDPYPPRDLAAAAAQFLREAFEAEYLVVFESASSAAFRTLVRDRRHFEPLLQTAHSAVYRIRPPSASASERARTPPTSLRRRPGLPRR